MKPTNFILDKKNPMAEEDILFLPIDKITKQTEDEYLFRFDVPVRHDPGQFVQCSLFGIGESAISICSHSETFFELSIRAVGNVTNKLCALKKGDKIGLRGPYGHGYKMEKFHGKDLIIIGGGSGAAPVRGIIQYVANNREKFGSVDLYFGFREKSFMLFPEDFKAWEDRNMKIHVALSEKNDFPGATKGYVTHLMGDEAPNGNTMTFLCGPPIMITSSAKFLLEKGFVKERLYISEERHMKCAVGRCGHCMIKGKYCCTDGPVFRWDEIYT